MLADHGSASCADYSGRLRYAFARESFSALYLGARHHTSTFVEHDDTQSAYSGNRAGLVSRRLSRTAVDRAYSCPFAAMFAGARRLTQYRSKVKRMDAAPKPLKDVLSAGRSDGLVPDRAQWTTSVDAVSMDGGLRYHADVFKNESFVCRMALSGKFEDQATAENEFERRLRGWIAEYEFGDEWLPGTESDTRARKRPPDIGD